MPFNWEKQIYVTQGLSHVLNLNYFERFLQPIISHHYIILDVETTGLYPQRGHRIIEIAAVAIDGKAVTGEFHTLINPGRKVTSTAQRLNGITNDMLADQPLPEQAYPDFYRFITGAILVAQCGFRCEFSAL